MIYSIVAFKKAHTSYQYKGSAKKKRGGKKLRYTPLEDQPKRLLLRHLENFSNQPINLGFFTSLEGAKAVVPYIWANECQYFPWLCIEEIQENALSDWTGQEVWYELTNDGFIEVDKPKWAIGTFAFGQ